MYLTQIELEVMQTFWKCNKSLSLSELIEYSPQKKWKNRSSFSIINGLMKKGLLIEDGYTHSGKTIARTFKPTISYTEFMIDQYDMFDGKISVPKLFAHLLGNCTIDSNDIKELENIIRIKKESLN